MMTKPRLFRADRHEVIQQTSVVPRSDAGFDNCAWLQQKDDPDVRPYSGGRERLRTQVRCGTPRRSRVTHSRRCGRMAEDRQQHAAAPWRLPQLLAGRDRQAVPHLLPQTWIARRPRAGVARRERACRGAGLLAASSSSSPAPTRICWPTRSTSLARGCSTCISRICAAARCWLAQSRKLPECRAGQRQPHAVLHHLRRNPPPRSTAATDARQRALRRYADLPRARRNVFAERRPQQQRRVCAAHDP